MIQRKPVPQASPPIAEQKLAHESIKEVAALPLIHEPAPPPYQSDTEDSLLDCYLESDVDEPPKHFDVEIPQEQLGIGIASVSSEPLATQNAPIDSRSTKVKHAFESAYSEAKYFAGGLISHPHESTRHYTILRHSLGLIYYRGPSTNVVITIFSDGPLPDDRTIWLQKRGFSGKTGLAVGAALGTRTAWIDVTPIIQRTPDELMPDQERAWQRDILSFSRKARDSKYGRDHVPRETNLIRIPHAAEDGYLRIVVCSGRKVLCPSPTFRYASTSADPGSLRGASLLTLPLEVGLKVGTRVATTAANAATHRTLKPASAVLQAASKQLECPSVPWLGVRGSSTVLEGDRGFSVRR